jgi:hypothetical protein
MLRIEGACLRLESMVGECAIAVPEQNQSHNLSLAYVE